MGLYGHEELVTSVKFTPNGRLVVSGSDDRTVRVWNASTGSCVRVLRGHTSMVRSVGVMPDGRRLVSAGTDGTIRVWDIETGQNLAVVGGRLGHVQALVTLPDGRTIVSGDYDRYLKLWDPSASTSHVAKLGSALHPAEIRSMASFPGTTKVAVGYIGNDDCTRIRVWDVAQAQVSNERPEAPPLWEAEGHGDTVLSLGIHKGDGLVSSGFDRSVRLWEPPSAPGSPTQAPQEAALVIESGENVPFAAAAWPDGRGLAYGCDDGSLHIWDLVRRREAMLHPDRHRDGVRTVDVSADGRMVVSSGADRCIRLLCVDEAAPAP